MYNGLTDIDQQGNIVPSIAESWEPNKELTAWTFRLRKGVLFHNGRELDAEAVKLNIMRIKDPAIGHEFLRGALDTIDSVEVLDKYTVRLNASMPDVSMPSNVMRYPTVLQAPDAFDTASDHPIGTGPFKFVSWTRWNETRLVRFENYWETDAEGHSLPYLDEIIVQTQARGLGAPDGAAHRPGAAHQYHGPSRYRALQRDPTATNTTSGAGVAPATLWSSTSGAGCFRTSACASRRRTPSTARPCITRCITGRAHMSDQPYPPGDPWHLEGIRSLEYDPDRAKAMLKEARAVGTQVKLVVNANTTIARETAQVVQDSLEYRRVQSDDGGP